MFAMSRKWKMPRWVTALICSVLACCPASAPGRAAEGDQDFNEAGHEANRVAAVAYVTWWSNDATGYHPAIALTLRNYSGKDLSGQLIRFQARFTDLGNGIVSLGKQDLRRAFDKNKELSVVLIGRQPYDLGIDKYTWPAIECKVMCRVGSVGDEGTQTLVVTRLEPVTMNNDEALQQLNRTPEFSQIGGRASSPARTASAPTRPAKPASPLVATAGKLGKGQEGKPKNEDGSAIAYIVARVLPGLGDDFYEFEKCYGLPAATNTGDQGWTWALYTHRQPAMRIVAGSRGKTGKVDMIIVEMPDPALEKEADLLPASRSLSGTMKMQKLSPPAHSVRYLPTGRLQLLTARAPGYRALYFTSPTRTQDGNTAFLVLSRLPGSALDLIAEHARHSDLIQPVAQVLGGI